MIQKQKLIEIVLVAFLSALVTLLQNILLHIGDSSSLEVPVTSSAITGAVIRALR